MLNFNLISKKNFLSLLKKANFILISIFNNLKFNNLKRLTKLFLIDKRVIFTLIIIFFSVFVHLSTPAFYKDSWVKGIVKSQFEKEFGFQIIFGGKLNYAIFPIPHFRFKDVKFISEESDLAKIELVKVYLTFSKFLDKNKMNIQNVVIKNAKFNFFKEDLNNLVNFFNRKINEKKITIIKSKIFLKDKDNDIYSIISINKSESIYNNIEAINNLEVDGDVFNNSFKLKLKNNFLDSKSNLDLVFDKLNKKFINIIDFKNKKKEGSLIYFDARKKYDTIYSFHNDILEFYSLEKIGDKTFYSGIIDFSPFSTKLLVNLKSINLKDLTASDSLFLEILKSNIFLNENLNFNIEVKSKNISNHRKLKDFSLYINYENQLLNFDQTNFILEDILKINLIESKFINKKKKYFLGRFEILINDHLNLYRFFQTKKEFRKKINSAYLTIRYDFLKDNLTIKELSIDNKSNEKIDNFIKQFNRDNEPIRNKADLRNLFNSFIEQL